MTDLPTIAREAASHCEAKLYAFRKSRDGTIVSFVLHPDEVPAMLNGLPIGARLCLAMVEIADDGTPK